MSDPTTLEDLKTLFLSPSNTISSRELFEYMEQILYGTQHFKAALDADDTSEVTSNQELFLKTNRKFGIANRYPALADKITYVDYTSGESVQEWDIGLGGPPSALGVDTGLYVCLDNRWVSRCSIGDDLNDDPHTAYKQLPFTFGLAGYRLANV